MFKLKKHINNTLKSFFNFIIPNFRLVLHGFSFDKSIVFNQQTVITGKGTLKLGKDCSFGYKPGGYHKYGLIELQARYKNSVIEIGNNVKINNNLFICSANRVLIGDNTLIGQGVTILDHESHGIEPENRKKLGEIGMVIIGKNVWIGNNVTILKNTFIGENTIIATGSVVSGTFPGNVIIGGVPAKFIRNI